MKDIEKRIMQILSEYGIDQNKISKDSDYYFDLNLDILDLMGFANKIKKEFMIHIPDHEIFKMERISDTIYFLENNHQMVLHN